MDKNLNIPMLLDIYGSALSKIQFDSLDLYYNEDLSLSEIAANLGKTRQGVFDSIKRAETILLSFEEKLGFLKKTDCLRKNLEGLKIVADKMDKENKTDLSNEIINYVKNIGGEFFGV